MLIGLSPNRTRHSGVTMPAVAPLLLILVLVAGLYGAEVHHHRDLASRQDCPLCISASHMGGEVVEENLDFQAAFLSYLIPILPSDPMAIDFDLAVAIRAPPSC